MAELQAQEIFATGEHNGLTFTEGDLDAIAKSFEALNLADRVPLKAGHDAAKPAKDGAPAWGWVQRVYRSGSKLLADFGHVPEKVMQLIRDKAYRYVSVELLKDVKAGTRTIPWTLDAVALLGADQPAVGSLRELGHNMSSRAALVYAGRQCFTRDYGDNDMSEIDSLRAENARLKQDAALRVVTEAINNGTCAPYVLTSFKRNYPNTALWSSEIAEEFVRANRQSEGKRRQALQTRGTSAFDSDDGGGDEGASNSQRFSSLVSRVQRELGYTAADLAADPMKQIAVLQTVQRRDGALWLAHAREPAES